MMMMVNAHVRHTRTLRFMDMVLLFKRFCGCCCSNTIRHIENTRKSLTFSKYCNIFIVVTYLLFIPDGGREAIYTLYELGDH